MSTKQPYKGLQTNGALPAFCLAVLFLLVFSSTAYAADNVMSIYNDANTGTDAEYGTDENIANFRDTQDAQDSNEAMAVYGNQVSNTSVVEQEPMGTASSGGGGGGGSALGDYFTPTLNVETGYDDNVRFRRNARGDAYLSISPGFRMVVGRPQNRFQASGNIRYVHYLTLSEYTQIEGGSLNLAYLNEPSQTFQWRAFANFNSTYDQAVVDEESNLVRIEGGDGRRDSGMVGVGFTSDPSERNSYYGGYSASYSTHTDDSVQDTHNHRVQLGGSWKLGPKWQGGVDASAGHDIYQDQSDVDQAQVAVTMSHFIGPSRQVFLQLGYTISRPLDPDDTRSDGKDYSVYTVSVGHSWSVSQAFSWGATLGWSRAERNEFNRDVTSGQGDPVFDLWVRWLGERWTFNAYTSARFVDYAFSGSVSGLSYSHRAGLSYTYRLERRLRFTVDAVYIVDDYGNQEEQVLAGEDRGLVFSTQAGAALTYDLGRHTSLSLEYRYINRDAENDYDDRSQNRVMLILRTEYPMGW